MTTKSLTLAALAALMMTGSGAVQAESRYTYCPTPDNIHCDEIAQVDEHHYQVSCHATIPFTFEEGETYVEINGSTRPASREETESTIAAFENREAWLADSNVNSVGLYHGPYSVACTYNTDPHARSFSGKYPDLYLFSKDLPEDYIYLAGDGVSCTYTDRGDSMDNPEKCRFRYLPSPR